MKVFGKISIFIITFIIVAVIFLDFKSKGVSYIQTNTLDRKIKVGVLVYSDDVFSSAIAKNLEDIQKEKGDNVEFKLFNANGNPAIESELLSDMLNSNYDLLLVNIAGQIVPELIENSVKIASQKSLPIIFFDVTPGKLDLIRRYPKALIINNDSKQGGTLQGKMIVDEWNNNKNTMDRNGDNILQYIMIKGNPESYATEERTKYSIKAIKDAGIQVQELTSVNANWDQELAKNSVELLFIQYDGKIEAIIANNDSMAKGAVKALQKYGYNNGDKKKTIPIFAINTSAEIEDLIKKGYIADSVPRNSRTFAEVIYKVGMNLINNKNPLDGINYKFDGTGVVINIPFAEYKGQNAQS